MEPLQCNLHDFSASSDIFAELRRDMSLLWADLNRYMGQMPADDAATQTMSTFRIHAQHLRHIPASNRTLLHPSVAALYVPECGKMQRWRLPYRRLYRGYGLLTAVVCRALV